MNGNSRGNEDVQAKTIRSDSEEAMHASHGRRSSQYVEVRGESDVAHVDERDQTSAWDLAGKEMNKAINTIKEKEQRVIQEGGVNEVNPWLERAG